MDIKKQQYILDRIIVDEETNCWNWQLATNNGYGRGWYNKRNEAAHRIAYKAFMGSIPKNKIICHECDNKLCCNPNHLWPGSHQENMEDMMNKNRRQILQIYKIYEEAERGGHSIAVVNDYNKEDLIIMTKTYYNKIKENNNDK